MADRIYLDANATACLRPEVSNLLASLGASATQPSLGSAISAFNASSVHAPGREARARIRSSRQAVATLLGFTDIDQVKIVFTGGGTEACNLCVYSTLNSAAGGHIVCSSIEHPAVLEPVKNLQTRGFSVSFIPVGADGIVEVDVVAKLVRADTQLVCLMAANNETGAIQPVVKIAQLLRNRGFVGTIFSDCTQLVGKSRQTVKELFDAGVDCVAFSAHKLGALGGVGVAAFNARQDRCTFLTPQVLGGSQEYGLRAGTENYLGIAALGEVATTLCARLDGSSSKCNLDSELEQRRTLAIQLSDLLRDNFSEVEILTPSIESAESSICNTVTFRVPGCRGDDLVAALDLEKVSISSGSACSSGKQSASHVLLAMGLDPSSAQEFIRVSLDWTASLAHIDEFVIRLRRVIARIQG